jgi:hypothetical protein
MHPTRTVAAGIGFNWGEPPVGLWLVEAHNRPKVLAHRYACTTLDGNVLIVVKPQGRYLTGEATRDGAPDHG